MIEQKSLKQDYRGQALEHVIVHDGTSRVLPTVIIMPTVMGVQPLELGFAERLVGLGYHAVVADFYGRRFTPPERAHAVDAMNALRADRTALRDLLLAIVEPIKQRPQVDAAKVAVIGFCFGGLCALDVARSGVDIAGVASFHGLFEPPGLPAQKIRAKVIAFHGWDDPLAPPDMVEALATELTEADADWQIHAYGHTRHGFTNPNAAAAGMDAVRFDEAAARRSWRGLTDFLDECFGAP